MKGPGAAARTAEHPQGRATFVRYTKGSKVMMTHQPESGNTPTDDIRDAAWNAVAVASIHWQQSVNALRSIAESARSHGLTVAEIAEAGGLDESHVVWLLEDAA